MKQITAHPERYIITLRTTHLLVSYAEDNTLARSVLMKKLRAYGMRGKSGGLV